MSSSDPAHEPAVLSGWLPRFQDPAVERAYREYRFDTNLPTLRVATVAIAVVLAAFSVYDRHRFPEHALALTWLRFGVLVPLAMLSIPFVWSPTLVTRVTRPYPRLFIGTFTLLGGAALLVMAGLMLSTEDQRVPLYLGLIYMLCLQSMLLVVQVPIELAVAFAPATVLVLAALVARRTADVASVASVIGPGVLGTAVGLAGLYMLDGSARRQFDLLRRIQVERGRAEAVLREVLPGSIVDRLMRDPHAIAEGFADVGVVFADLVAFAPLAARLPPERLVRVLDEIFTAFDAHCDAHGLEKIKTMGDRYMAAAGVPDRHPDPATATAELALAMMATIEGLEPVDGVRLQLRVGLHVGPVVAGVIGRSRFVYDLWGDTVNVAARMNSHSDGGRIQVSDELAARLRDRYELERRGAIPVKGKGEMTTWYLRGKRDASVTPIAGEP